MNKFISVFRSSQGERAVIRAYDELMKQISVDGSEVFVPCGLGETHVYCYGAKDAPPVFLIHAFYASSAAWYKNIEPLSKYFRVYVVDIIGDPNKSRPNQLIRKAFLYCEWMRELMAFFNLSKASFIGNSIGAFHILNFALHYPAMVQKLVLIGPAASLMGMPEFYIRTFPGGITGWKFPVNYALRWVENSSPLEPGIRKLFFLAQIHGKAANQVFPRVFTDEELRKLKVPVLLMYGEKEVIYNYTKAIRRAESLIETIQTVIIPEANHFTAVSRPEEVNRRILEFLSEPKT